MGKTIIERATEEVGSPKKSDSIIKVVNIDGIDVYFKKKFDKERKVSFWKFSKMENQ